jgi:hypothetical protein
MKAAPAGRCAGHFRRARGQSPHVLTAEPRLLLVALAALLAGPAVSARPPVVARAAAPILLAAILPRSAILPGAPLGPGVAARHAAIMTGVRPRNKCRYVRRVQDERCETPRCPSPVASEIRTNPLQSEERRALDKADVCWIAAPLPVVRVLAHSGADWIHRDVPEELKRMTLGRDQHIAEAPRQPSPVLLVSSVELLHIAAVQALHAGAEVRQRGLYQQVVMRGHHAVRVTRPFKACHCFRDEVEERLAVPIVAKKSSPCNTVRGYVVSSAGGLDAVSTGHDPKLDGFDARSAGRRTSVTLTSRFCFGV